MIYTSPKPHQIEGAKFLVNKRVAIVGAKTGKGKTLVVLACIHRHVYGKEDYAVVFAPVKAYDKVWPQEIKKHSDMKVIKLEEAFERWKKEKTVTFLLEYDIVLAKYSQVKADYYEFLALIIPGRITAYDECLTAQEKITLADGSTKRISELVSKQMQVDVLSYNKETGVTEAKPITGWFRNSPKTVVRVRTERMTNGAALRGSEGHLVYTPEGKKELGSLKVGDIVYNKDKGVYDFQKEIIRGVILGDASCGFTSTGRARLSFVHSYKYYDYIKLKYGLLSNLVNSEGLCFEDTKNDKSCYGDGYYTFSTLSSFNITDVMGDLYITGKKMVTRSFLDKLTPLSIFFWVVDDGSVYEDSTSLNTQSFGLEGNMIIIKYFWERWGIEYKLVPDKRFNPVLYSLRTNKESTKKLLSLISAYYQHNSTGKYTGVRYEVFNSMLEQAKKKFSGMFEDKVLTIDRPNWGLQTMYDIEVADNHNYFANGLLVSNCHKLKNPGTKLARLLSNVTRDAKAKWGITATAIGNSILDLWGLMYFLDARVLGTEWQFKKEYCVMEEVVIGWTTKFGRKVPDTRLQVVDYQNLDKLKAIVADYLWTVPSDLSVTFHDIRYDITNEEEEAYIQAAKGILEIDKVKGFAQRMPDLQRVVDGAYDKDGNKTVGFRSSKYQEYVKFISSLLAKDQSLILFAEFIDTFEMLHSLLTEDLPGVPIYRISGSYMEYHEDEVQLPCIILSTIGGTESLNLKFANHVLCFSLPFAVNGFIQLVGRITRMDSDFLEDLNVYLPVCETTIDLYKYTYLMNNAALINDVLGRDANLPEKKLTDMRTSLMAELRKNLLWRVKVLKKNSTTQRTIGM